MSPPADPGRADGTDALSSPPGPRATGSDAATAETGKPRPNKHVALLGTPLLLAAVVLAAANFRPAVTSMSSILGEVRADVGASAVWASALTALPTVCFGLAAVVGPWFRRLFGVARAVGIALTVITVGLVLRVLDGQWVVLGGTFIAAGGIAVGNVLIPVVVKESFPKRIGLATGFYTAALNGGAALASAITPPLTGVLGGWRLSLGVWAVLAAAALALWALGARHGSHPVTAEEPDTADAPGQPPIPPGQRPSLLRSPLAWAVTLFMGLQSLLAYVAMGWITELFVSYGVPRDRAALMLALVSLLGVPLSLIVAPLAMRRASQSGWIVGLVAFGLVGVLGLLVAPTTAPWLWTTCIGVGMGVFALALGVISLRARDGVDATRLSAQAQGYGYLIASAGPFLFGLLHAVTGGWTASLVFVAAMLCVLGVVGWIAGRPRFV